MYSENDEIYWLWLCSLEGIWNGTISKIIEEFGNAKKFFCSTDNEVLDFFKKDRYLDKISDATLSELLKSRKDDNIDKLIKYMNSKNIKFISYLNSRFPEKLKSIDKMPYGLFYIGNLGDYNKKTISIVGARNCTEYGREIAYKLGMVFAQNNINTVSGMARGIDSSCHWGTIDANGNTYGVLGCGVDVCYPRDNIELYEKIVNSDRCGIISEFMPRAKAEAWRFPVRNRIISALSDIIIVIEAKKKSGSLITVEYGLEQGKDIYAIPGRLGDKLSEGCNKLIRDGAGIISSIDDFVEEIGCNKIEAKEKNKNKFLEKNLDSLYSCLDSFPKSLDEISNEMGINQVEILKDITELEVLGLAIQPSKYYYMKH